MAVRLRSCLRGVADAMMRRPGARNTATNRKNMLAQVGHPGSVFGQIIQCNLLREMRKEGRQAPMTFVDPRAGEGVFRVRRDIGYRTHVHDGVDVLWALEQDPETRLKRDKQFRDYIKLLKHHNIDSDGYLYPEVRMMPSGGEILRQYMRPGDRLIMAEEDPQMFAQLEELYGDDPSVTLVQESDADAMLHHLPPRNPTGLLYYECALGEDPGDFIRYLDRFPLATVCISYTTRNVQDDMLSDITMHEDFEEGASDSLKYAHRPISMFRRVVRRGFRHVLGAEMRYNYGRRNSSPSGCGVIIANPPIEFDSVLEKLLPKMETLFQPIQGSGAEYYWTTKAPSWMRHVRSNSRKLPWNYKTVSRQMLHDKAMSVKTDRRTTRWQRLVKENKTIRARIQERYEKLRKAKLRRRYDGEFNQDVDPADPEDLFLPAVKRSYKWRAKDLAKSKRSQAE